MTTDLFHRFAVVEPFEDEVSFVIDIWNPAIELKMALDGHMNKDLDIYAAYKNGEFLAYICAWGSYDQLADAEDVSSFLNLVHLACARYGRRPSWTDDCRPACMRTVVDEQGNIHY